jgi:trehalose 6-phosphate phosphatase
MTLLTAAAADATLRPALDPAAAALFLDFDGTLAPLAPRPEDVRKDDELNRLLVRLAGKLHGRLAVVSGRTVTDVDRLLGGAAPAVAGVHGLERRSVDGRIARAAPPPGLEPAREALAAFCSARPGLLLEDKGLGVALHYRQAPDCAGAARSLAARLADEHGLAFQPGDMVAELRAPGADKGAAVRAFMSEPPFAGAVPVFVGDDLTDEHGFEAAVALGGRGVLVGPPRQSAARERLEDVPAVRAWIEAIAR